MIETLAVFARGIQTAAGCALIGWIAYRVFCLHRSTRPPSRAVDSLLALVFLIAGIATIGAQTALASGREQDLVDLGAWRKLIESTRFGRIWLWREALMLAALFWLWLSRLTRGAWRDFVALLLAVPAAGLMGSSGHAAALEPAWPGMLAHGLHVVVVGAWWGGLLPLALTLRQPKANASFRQSFRRFSMLATGAMSVILVTGLYLAFAHIESWPPLFGTDYGQLLLLKLVLFAVTLGLAARLRWGWLKQISRISVESIAIRAGRLVVWEAVFALSVMAIASILASTPPARHEQVLWPFGFRISPQVTWSQPGVKTQVFAGSVLAVVSLLKIFWFWKRGIRWRSFSLSAALALLGMALALPPLAVPAFPDSYRRSVVAYHTISIDGGANLFKQHCTTCHGKGGLGDGPLAQTLPKPAANLSAPHTADHTAGDMFWWLTHGIPAGKMPGFDKVLSEEERWDLINFLRAFSSGYQARIIRARIAPMQPWLGAPDFNYVLQSGESGALKGLRGDRPVVLVFFSWPESGQRLEQWATMKTRVEDAGAKVITMPLHPLSEKSFAALPVAEQGAGETARSYLLFRRTLSNLDQGDLGPPPTHMEMLIDRFGYVRARWLPRENDDWADMSQIMEQIGMLKREPEILPPPDEHIH